MRLQLKHHSGFTDRDLAIVGQFLVVFDFLEVRVDGPREVGRFLEQFLVLLHDMIVELGVVVHDVGEQLVSGGAVAA